MVCGVVCTHGVWCGVVCCGAVKSLLRNGWALDRLLSILAVPQLVRRSEGWHGTDAQADCEAHMRSVLIDVLSEILPRLDLDGQALIEPRELQAFVDYVFASFFVKLQAPSGSSYQSRLVLVRYLDAEEGSDGFPLFVTTALGGKAGLSIKPLLIAQVALFIIRFKARKLTSQELNVLLHFYDTQGALLLVNAAVPVAARLSIDVLSSRLFNHSRTTNIIPFRVVDLHSFFWLRPLGSLPAARSGEGSGSGDVNRVNGCKQSRGVSDDSRELKFLKKSSPIQHVGSDNYCLLTSSSPTSPIVGPASPVALGTCASPSSLRGLSEMSLSDLVDIGDLDGFAFNVNFSDLSLSSDFMAGLCDRPLSVQELVGSPSPGPGNHVLFS